MDSVRKIQSKNIIKFLSRYNSKNRKSKNICVYLFRCIIIYKMQDIKLWISIPIYIYIGSSTNSTILIMIQRASSINALTNYIQSCDLFLLSWLPNSSMALDAIHFHSKRGIIEDLIYHWHLYSQKDKKKRIKFKLSRSSIGYMKE